MPKPALQDTDSSIIVLDKFIQATRDSGYKGTASAVAELVDNAVEARAMRIAIRVTHTGTDARYPIEVAVHDDGAGMDPFTLRQALRFGGSSRFNSRSGLGRYGMGLPNSSMSQARRVTVYTWQSPGKIYSSYLDVDEIIAGHLTAVPIPHLTKHPFERDVSKTGTVVVWSHCDRLEHRRVSTIVQRLLAALGRRFRYFIWDGVEITINGDVVEPIDPLFLHPQAKISGAERFGEPLEYEVLVDPDNGGDETGIIRVTFTELPVHEWHKFSNEEKRKLGIATGAGVSVVRARREVDYGWFFLNGKRRENYDDWWRCEIQFDPVLDELFGITHTKQQVRPKASLLELLSPDIEAAARALNARARRAHLGVKTSERFSQSEKIATELEQLFEPLPSESRAQDRTLLKELKQRHPLLRKPHSANGQPTRLDYKIVESSIRDTAFFTYVREEGRLILVLNLHHPFYKQIYKPLVESDAPQDHLVRTHLELLLLAAARSEANEANEDAAARLEQQRLRWSHILATFLNG